MTTEAPTGPKNILSLSKAEKRKFLDSFDNVFSDIDGVVWNMEGVIEGAVGGINVLQATGKHFKFLTNNSLRTVEQFAKKLNATGIQIDVNNIINPAKSVVDYLKSINFEGLIYIIAAEPFKTVLRDAGYTLLDGPNQIFEESLIALSRVVFDKEPVRAVVIDEDFNMSSTKLIKAHFYLNNPECLLIAGATDVLLPVRKDINILGPGPFSKILQETTKRHMITLGKPGRELAALLMKRFEIKDTKRTLMIGDMLKQDIGFGKQCDFQTLLVLSGGSSRVDLDAITETSLMPDYYAESMADFVQFMNELNKSNV